MGIFQKIFEYWRSTRETARVQEFLATASREEFIEYFVSQGVSREMAAETERRRHLTSAERRVAADFDLTTMQLLQPHLSFSAEEQAILFKTAADLTPKENEIFFSRILPNADKVQEILRAKYNEGTGPDDNRRDAYAYNVAKGMHARGYASFLDTAWMDVIGREEVGAMLQAMQAKK